MEGFMRGVSNNLLLRHYRSNCIYQGESVTAQVAGRNSGFAHNRQRARQTLQAEKSKLPSSPLIRPSARANVL
jgi:hypothetical protein